MKEKKRLHLFLPAYIHTQIKEEAAKKEITITSFIIRAVLEQLSKPIPKECMTIQKDAQ